jgi:hypothetical protein
MLLTPRPLGHAIALVLPLTLIYASICLSAWWVCRSHPLATTPALRVVINSVTAAVQAAAVLAALATGWAALLARRFGVSPGHDATLRDVGVLFFAGLLLYLQSIAVHYFVLTFESAREAERRVLASQVSAREAELRALRAQLNPHFLFNSLNSINALTGSDPESARRMCQLLGDFLRSSLALGARERVTLGEELELAGRYLSIEQVRFGTRLAVERAVAPEAERCLVPPLLIQPLIENAVKHGVADRIEGGTIRIEAAAQNGTLLIAVENPRDPDAPPRRGQGLGLENVRQRLSALDPHAGVDVTREPERFRVAVRLPAIEADPASGGSALAASTRATSRQEGIRVA